MWAPLALLVLVLAIAVQVVAVVDTDGTSSPTTPVVLVDTRSSKVLRRDEVQPAPPGVDNSRSWPRLRTWVSTRWSAAAWRARAHPTRGP